jgi:hypothetical protein
MRDKAAQSAREEVMAAMKKHGPSDIQMSRRLKKIVKKGKDRDAIQAIKLCYEQKGAMAPQKQDVNLDGKIDVTVSFVNAKNED